MTEKLFSLLFLGWKHAKSKHIGQFFNDVLTCVSRTFLDRCSISKIQNHISLLLVNLGFTMPSKLYSVKILKIPLFKLGGGVCFEAEGFLEENCYFPCRLHRTPFCFVICLMLIPNDLLNQILWIIWPCCNINGEFSVYVLKKSSNFSLNLIHFL